MTALKYVKLITYAIGFRQKEADMMECGRPDKTATGHERRSDVPRNVRPFRVQGACGGEDDRRITVGMAFQRR
jgi:hypothetical protein